ncbi:hypothetical protein BIW11_03638 [Tropilaelaps mercedesae]|uniref:Uncharacterized protein n=1 Tax=Tropilaelaps mercedesae TaxID=418985 RepID=A0A1V9XI90_9ACAR|nr:hypothetical protein BIW11_03638 [Tropilaelaps mercedesae]
MSRYGGYGAPHSANGGHFHHQGPPPTPYVGMYDRFERGFDGRHGGGFYGDYYGSCYPGGPASYPGGPGRYEPYGAPPGRLGGDRRSGGGVRPKATSGGAPKGASSNLKSGASNAKKTGGGRRASGKRTSAVQFTASRSRLKPPFVISQSKWGNSNRSSWIFPRFGDYIDTEDTPIWLTPDDLITKFEVPPDNQYCPDCGVLIINLKRHKASDIHREKLEEKRGQVAKWKLEFMERKRKYEERKALGGKGDDQQDDKDADEADEDGNGVEDDDEEEETGEADIEEDAVASVSGCEEFRHSQEAPSGDAASTEGSSKEGVVPQRDQANGQEDIEAMDEAMETADTISNSGQPWQQSSNTRRSSNLIDSASTCNGTTEPPNDESAAATTAKVSTSSGTTQSH